MKWTPTDDVVLISPWLNTSKDHVVGNEQSSGAFWKRIAAYFAAILKLAANRERQVTVSNVGTRSMTLFASFMDHMKLQLERKAAVKMRMMFSN